MIYASILGIIAGIICLIKLRKSFKEKITKNVMNIFANITILSCNTILYCVLYTKESLLEFIFSSLFITLILYLGLNDLMNKKITNKLNALILLLGLCKNVTMSLYNSGDNVYNYKSLVYTLLFCIIIFAIMYIIQIISKTKVGGGDVKFIALLPLYYSLENVLYIILFASILASICGIYFMIVKSKTKNYELPFGVFLSMACIALLLIN